MEQITQERNEVLASPTSTIWRSTPLISSQRMKTVCQIKDNYIQICTGQLVGSRHHLDVCVFYYADKVDTSVSIENSQIYKSLFLMLTIGQPTA